MTTAANNKNHQTNAENTLKKAQEERQKRIAKLRQWSYAIFGLAVASFVAYCFKSRSDELKPLLYASIVLLIISVLLYLPVDDYIFDNKEYEQSEDIYDFIYRLRLRAILFNNLSILVFIVTVFVIVCSFYLLIHTDTSTAQQAENLQRNAEAFKLNYLKLTSQVGSVVILVFLVQILFRVFKYLLRVAAFYNGKADALELTELNSTYVLKDLLESFTPNNYDISDVDSPGVLPKT